MKISAFMDLKKIFTEALRRGCGQDVSFVKYVAQLLCISYMQNGPQEDGCYHLWLNW